VPIRYFQAGGPLAPGDAAFAAGVYDSTTLAHLGLASFAPRIIASPRLTGKTTELFYLRRLHEYLSGGQCRFLQVVVPSAPGRIGETGLRRLLGSVLMCSPDLTLHGMLSSSRKTRGRGHKVLAIREVDNLSREALIWLLRNLTALNDGVSVCQTRATQVVIDGSVALDRLAGHRAPFAVQGLPPAEFSPLEQERFVRSRAKKLRCEVPRESQARIWARTLGDKYLTQALCLRLFTAQEQGRPISPARVDRAANDYADGAAEADPLFSAIEFIARAWVRRHQTAAWVTDTESISREWWLWDGKQQRMAYAGGFVRRTQGGKVVLRAPMLARAIAKLGTRMSISIGRPIEPSSKGDAPPETASEVSYVNAWLLGCENGPAQISGVHVLCLNVGEWRRRGNLVEERVEASADGKPADPNARFEFIVTTPHCLVTALRTCFIASEAEPARFELVPVRTPRTGRTKVTVVVCRDQTLLHVVTLEVAMRRTAGSSLT
jgi:hypothetical protein